MKHEDGMYLLLEHNNAGRWTQAENTMAYESAEEAEEVGKQLELFDTIIVKYIKFI
jgi:hypothetical protein